MTEQFSSLNLSKDLKWFRTIHSCCCAKLGIGYNDTISNADMKEFSQRGWPMKNITDPELLYEDESFETNFDIVLNARSIASHMMVPIEDVLRTRSENPAVTSYSDFLADYERFKKERGKIDFVDMLEDAVGQGALSGVSVILVDESQDLSNLQWKLIEEWSDGIDYLYLAGDDDQAIYTFMGSSENGFLDYGYDKQVVLKRSYRCPERIGQFADAIIKRVQNREPKDVEWNERSGDIKFIGDPSIIDWRGLAEGDSSVLVLTRHRKQGNSLSLSLQDAGIVHTVNGKSPWDGRGHIKDYIILARGGSVSPAKASSIAKKAGYLQEAKRIREESARNASITKQDLNIPWTNNWPQLFAKNEKEKKELYAISDMISQYGIEIIGKQINIDISTYHGSKGREADTVILLTDCYKSAWQDQNTDTEKRLAYVGVTRSKNDLIIVYPQTDMYMTSLV